MDSVVDQIAEYLNPLKKYCCIVEKFGHDSSEAYEAQLMMSEQTKRLLGHVKRLWKEGIDKPIADIYKEERKCCECKKEIDDNLYNKLFKERKIIICYNCWRLLYPIDE